MIIANLRGGLGNQMFQYAAARRLALQHGTEVVLDCSHFIAPCPACDIRRSYQLDHFSVNARFATALEVAEMSGSYRGFWQQQLFRLRRIAGQHSYPVKTYLESSIHFHPEVLSLLDNVYMSGYWQSERYFSDVSSTIRKDLTVRDALAGKNLELARRIGSSESVAVHFRRGDYVSSAKTTAFHGVLSPDYYQRALGTLQERIDRPRLFVFSDDPRWVRQNVKFSVPFEVVGHNPPGYEHEDLRLMSLCRHAIIANSSFSWWGAWLNSNPDKVVIAPRRWFADERMNSSDLIPPNWLRVE